MNTIETSDVLYVPELARILGRTEKAIRAGISKSRKGGQRIGWLPPYFRLGNKYAWRRAVVNAWLAEQAAAGDGLADAQEGGAA